jgi:hypothetical protein
MAKEESSWHWRQQRHLGSGRQRCMWLRATASRMMGQFFGSRGSYCGDSNITIGDGNINDNVKKCLFFNSNTAD